MIGWLKSIRWKTRTRRSVFVTLLVSYILIMLIPLGIGAFIYGRMSAAMVEQAVRSNSGLLEQAKQAIDQRLADLDKVSIQIALNTKLLSLLGNGPDSQRNESLVHSEVIRDFGRLLASNGFIDELYVYLRNGDIILTSSMKTDTDIFFNWIQPTTQPDAAAKMRAFLSQTHYREFLLPISYNTDSNRSSKRVISYVQSLPIEEQQSVRGSLVIQFEENKLLQVLKQIEWVNQGDIVIVDDKGQVITSTSPNRNEWSSLSEQLTKEGDSLETRLGGSQ
ncbi:MAG: AraC family transcriptional regulator, partial [Paenibacillus sp.]|nr:AraC family transcriptional regulator [Paenibacillus sp.]